MSLGCELATPVHVESTDATWNGPYSGPQARLSGRGRPRLEWKAQRLPGATESTP